MYTHRSSTNGITVFSRVYSPFDIFAFLILTFGRGQHQRRCQSKESEEVRIHCGLDPRTQCDRNAAQTRFQLYFIERRRQTQAEAAGRYQTLGTAAAGNSANRWMLSWSNDWPDSLVTRFENNESACKILFSFHKDLTHRNSNLNKCPSHKVGFVSPQRSYLRPNLDKFLDDVNHTV